MRLTKLLIIVVGVAALGVVLGLTVNMGKPKGSIRELTAEEQSVQDQLNMARDRRPAGTMTPSGSVSVGDAAFTGSVFAVVLAWIVLTSPITVPVLLILILMALIFRRR